MPSPAPIVLLFDIDRTLLIAGPQPVQAMLEAGQSMYGGRFTLEGVNRSGNLDHLIFAQACRLSGVKPHADDPVVFRERYCRLLGQSGLSVKRLPHADDLLRELSSSAFNHVILGAVTGNYACAGRLKLQRAGWDRVDFVANGFGDEAETRPALVRLALQRAAASIDLNVSPDRVLIIGDTPRDIHAARANRCRVWAVTTGKYDADALADATVVTDRLPKTASELLSALSLPLRPDG